jgi:hypothetical protein
MQTKGNGSVIRRKRAVLGTGSLILVAMVVIGVHVLALGAVADAESGRSPATAILLRKGQNAGALGPGEAQWYKLVQAGDDGALQRQVDLTLIFTPDDGRRSHSGPPRSQRIALQIFTAEQVAGWYPPDTSQTQSVGAGEIVSRDGNPDTGELLWSGWAVTDSTYYVRVFNASDASIDYRLFTDNVVSAQMGEGSGSTPGLEMAGGADLDRPVALKPQYQTSRLGAGQETWYPIVYNDRDSQVYEEHTFSLVFAPDDGVSVGQVGFEVIPRETWQALQKGESRQLPGMGVGQAVSHDPDPLTGERLWSGWLMDGRAYYVRLHNDGDAEIEYWLFFD